MGRLSFAPEFSTGERPTGIPEQWAEHREVIFDLLALAYQADALGPVRAAWV